MTKRKLENWLLSYKEYTAGTEPPPHFHLWVGLSTLSAVVGRKVIVNMGRIPVVPNLYVMLVAPPGECRKGQAIKFSYPFLDAAGVRKVSDSTTREALIKELADTRRIYALGEGARFMSAMSIVSEELGSLLRNSPGDMLTFLTDIYDCKHPWEYKTKGRTEGRRTDKIYFPFVSFLCGTTPTYVAEHFPKEAIGEGFTSRAILVYCDKRGEKHAWPEMTNKQKELEEDLILDIQTIENLHGEMEVSEEAKELFIYWYEKAMDKERIIADPRFTPYYSRKHRHVLAVAVLLSISSSENLVLNENHLTQAIELLNLIEPLMPKAFAGLGRNPLAAVTEQIITFAAAKGSFSLKEIVKEFIKEASIFEIEQIMSSLKLQGLVEFDLQRKLYVWRKK